MPSNKPLNRPPRRKPTPPAGDAEARRDIDNALAKAKELGLFRGVRNEDGVASVLLSVLRGQALDPVKRTILPDEQQYHPWLSTEDANFVLNIAKRNGWLKPGPGVTESRKIEIKKGDLCKLIAEAIQGRQPGSPLWEAPTGGPPSHDMDGGFYHEPDVSGQEIAAWLDKNNFNDAALPQAVKAFSRSLQQLQGERELSEEALEILYDRFPDIMSQIEMGMGESKKRHPTLKEAIQARQPGSPLWEAPEEFSGSGHPLESDDNGITMPTKRLLTQLATQVADDLEAMEGIPLDTSIGEISDALTQCVREFFDGTRGNW